MSGENIMVINHVCQLHWANGCPKCGPVIIFGWLCGCFCKRWALALTSTDWVKSSFIDPDRAHVVLWEVDMQIWTKGLSGTRKQQPNSYPATCLFRPLALDEGPWLLQPSHWIMPLALPYNSENVCSAGSSKCFSKLILAQSAKSCNRHNQQA